MCTHLCIEAQESKVHPATEDKVYNDEFFSRQDLVVNALDNVEARRYVDRSDTASQSISHPF